MTISGVAVASQGLTSNAYPTNSSTGPLVLNTAKVFPGASANNDLHPCFASSLLDSVNSVDLVGSRLHREYRLRRPSS